MTCYHPLKGYRVKGGGWTANKRQSATQAPLSVPCGQCIGCRIDKTQAWAVRMYHESQLHEANCFITLTYDDENLPLHHSLNKKDFQQFMYRLRDRLKPRKIRFFHCGEYGDETSRPHYHAIIFGYDFPDKYLFTKHGENDAYRSNLLENLWQKGNSEIEDFTPTTAAYVAGYITKKISGKSQADYYAWTDPITHERHERVPPYATMSNRPGIGADWYKKFHKDVFPGDFCVLDGRKVAPPLFYLERLKETDPDTYQALKTQRKSASRANKDNNTDERLAVRETVTIASRARKTRDRV